MRGGVGLKSLNTSLPRPWCNAKILPILTLPPLRGAKNLCEAKRRVASQARRGKIVIPMQNLKSIHIKNAKNIKKLF